ncbi:globin domain-containing protein [uncultured Shewanella sp.]|uniref:globin domain-containing protein n=1 Tax=Shewanella atlantica TaxID=271099 RepID=UPI0026176DC6|nr:globin domain-containing protein [uncultured Shewanella sp.]
MKLTTQEKKLIQRSFLVLNQSNKSFATCFYDCLFELAPLIKPMFKSERRIFEQHFHELISTAVNKIENFDDIQPILLKLGQKHKEYGVKKEQFGIVKTALILSVQYQLKSGSNSAIEQAWSNYYDQIAEVMIEGLSEQATSPNTAAPGDNS